MNVASHDDGIFFLRFFISKIKLLIFNKIVINQILFETKLSFKRKFDQMKNNIFI